MELLNEEDIVSIHIDLEELKKNELNESFLAMFGSSIKLVLDRMFGGRVGSPAGWSISGRRGDVASFAKTIGREKKYIESSKKHGLDNPRTFKDKKKLDKAISGFEKDTGLKWPFK
jgi:hypothetical protein